MTDRDLDSDSRVIRVFPSYAGTALWAAFGEVEYADSRLSPALIAAFREWEALGEQEGLTGVPLAPEVEVAWVVEGERLANELAAELGAGFMIEMRGGSTPVVVSSQDPPSNPSAAAALESRRLAYVADEVAWQERLAAMSPEERASLRWEPLRVDRSSLSPGDVEKKDKT